MPISRVMNLPDGSTPMPPVGGGDVNGTLAVSVAISSPGGGTAGDQISVPRHIHFQTDTLGLPSPALPLVASEEEMISGEDSARIGAEQQEEEVEASAEDLKPLSEIPENPEEVEQWLEENRAITAPPEPKEPEPKTPRQPRSRR